jgi:D-sedoheptulose 7-phosphate isomerase
MSWFNHIEKLNIHLQSLSIRNNDGEEIEANAGFSLWAQYTLRVRERRKTVFLIGNGASASMASHVAADLAKNAYIRTEVFSDLSLITAIANDISFEEVFAEPLRRRMTTDDMLVAISSSGQSPNIIRAAEEARNLRGIVVTLSAMRVDNPLRKQGILNFYLPAETYSLAETCHAAILHHWIDQMVSPISK